MRHWLGSIDLTAEIIQDLIVRWSRIDTIIPIGARTYLFRMAINLAVDHGKADNRRAEIRYRPDRLTFLDRRFIVTRRGIGSIDQKEARLGASHEMSLFDVALTLIQVR
ncbi:hypothetical protein [Sphingomonas sp. ERG5]|uniref:hypothetical protein n=1 Tax=Sphingomonas sp. ERG5 TaxID=1381597 RepID=UPI00054C4F77|nr:hypothetical protein [Sphingomonas sp. ERG5]